MDLAAERMYPNFVILRERYWKRLDAQQRRNAIERGQPLLAEYGDDAAKPRMERKLRIANHQVTGSRLGFIRPGLTVRPFTGPLAGQTITARSEEHTSELQSLMRISYAVFCLQKQNTKIKNR